MEHNLQIRRINDKKYMVSVNDTNKIFVNKIYFSGKNGADDSDYAEAARKFTKSDDDTIQTITLNNLKMLEPDDELLIIFVDSPFKFRFERLLDIFTPERINKMVEKENNEFPDVTELLSKFKHLIIQ